MSGHLVWFSPRYELSRTRRPIPPPTSDITVKLVSRLLSHGRSHVYKLYELPHRIVELQLVVEDGLEPMAVFNNLVENLNVVLRGKTVVSLILYKWFEPVTPLVEVVMMWEALLWDNADDELAMLDVRGVETLFTRLYSQNVHIAAFGICLLDIRLEGGHRLVLVFGIREGTPSEAAVASGMFNYDTVRSSRYRAHVKVARLEDGRVEDSRPGDQEIDVALLPVLDGVYGRMVRHWNAQG